MAKIINNKNTEISKNTENFGEHFYESVENSNQNLQNSYKNSPEKKIKVKKLSWWAKLFLFLVAFLSIFIIALGIFLNLDWTRNKFANLALDSLNKDFGVQISKDSVDVNFFGDVSIYGLKIKDFKENDLIKAKKLRADSDWFSIITNSRDIKFHTITLTEADVNVVTYKGDSIDNFNRFIEKFDDGKPINPKKKPFQLNSRIIIENTKISIINQNQEGEEGNWLQATNVNAIVPNLKVVGPDVSARINNFSFNTKRWGKEHQMKTFSTDLVVTKTLLKMTGLTLETDHSLLEGDLVFNLDQKTHWQDFTNKVNWDMNLKRGSAISGYDISYFATKWDNYKAIALSGKMNGVLNSFQLKDFLLKGKDVEIYTPDSKFYNVLKGNFNIITPKISANFTYPSLRALVPEFVAKKMKNFADPFGTIKYNGSANVTPTKVIAKGTAITSIGQAIADITLSDINLENPRYKGKLNIKNFNAAALTKNNAVGLITGNFDVDGRGFDVNTLVLNTKSDISSIEITGKTINNLKLNGVLAKRIYNGTILVNDEEAKGKITGKIDFSTPKLIADINGAIDYLNLSYFGVQGNGKAVFSGNVDGKIAFNTINDMNLDATLNNVKFTLGNQKISVPNGGVKAFFENGNRIVSVDMPNVVKGTIKGKYQLEDISKMFQNGMDKILVGKPNKKRYSGQQFTYDFTIEQVLINYFETNLKIPEGAKLDGFYNGNTNDIAVNAHISNLKYIMTKKEELSEADRLLVQANPDYRYEENKITKDSAMVKNLLVRINTAQPQDHLFAKIDRVEYNKNVVQDIFLTGINENNALHITANFKHGTPEDELNETMKSYAVNLSQHTDENGDNVLKFDPTELKINNFTWNVDTSQELNHSITYRKKTGDFLVQNMRLFSENSELFVNGVFKDAKNFNGDVDVKNLDISKLLDLFPGNSNIDLKGIANGNMKIKMDQKNLQPIIDLEVKDIVLSGKNMGNMVISAKNSTTPNVFDINAKIVSSDFFGKNNLELNGTIDNNTKSPTLNLDANFDDFDLGFSQEFVKTVFSDMRGKANGTLKISGPMNNIDYSGDIGLKGFGLKLIFTGVDYALDDTTISLTKGMAEIAGVKIKDGRENSSGYISGSIYFETLSSMAVNLILTANNLLVLNTTQKDYDLFWGTVYGKGDLYISGPVSGLSLETPKMKALNNSVFTFNSNSTSSVDEFKMLRFLKENKTGELTFDEKTTSGANMNVDFSLEVDKGTEVNVLVGDKVGDIKVRGSADNLRFRMSRAGKIAMNGNYIVDNGTYFSKKILDRTFFIENGSEINWEGNPTEPTLNITADYYKTVRNASDYLNLGSLPPLNLLLQIKITETMSKPKLDFVVSAPDVSTQVKEALSEKMSRESERTLQFGSILMLNSFNTSNTGGFGDVDLNSTAIEEGTNILLKQFENIINNISEQFKIDINYNKANPGSSLADRANIGGKLILSPRINLKTSMGIPISKSETLTNNSLSVDGIVEWDVSKSNDGSLLLRGYSKQSNIGLGANISSAATQNYGIGIVYSNSFNTLFKKKKNDKKKDQDKLKIKTDSLKKDTLK